MENNTLHISLLPSFFREAELCDRDKPTLPSDEYLVTFLLTSMDRFFIIDACDALSSYMFIINHFHRGRLKIDQVVLPNTSNRP